jgi:hypothetical protein
MHMPFVVMSLAVQKITAAQQVPSSQYADRNHKPADPSHPKTSDRFEVTQAIRTGLTPREQQEGIKRKENVDARLVHHHHDCAPAARDALDTPDHNRSGARVQP